MRLTICPNRRDVKWLSPSCRTKYRACRIRRPPVLNSCCWRLVKDQLWMARGRTSRRRRLPRWIRRSWSSTGASISLQLRVRQNRGCRRRRRWLRGDGDAVRRPRRVRDTASGETPVQLLVLSQHAFGGCLKVISRGCKEVHDRGTSEILRRETESVGFVAEPFCLRWRKIDGELHGDSVLWRRPVQQPASADRLPPAADRQRYTRTWTN